MVQIDHFSSTVGPAVRATRGGVRKFLKSIVVTVFVIGFLFACRVVDPLDIDQSSLQTAELIIARVYGAWHPRTFCLFRCAESIYSRNDIAVVLIGDDFQHRVGSSLVPFEYYAKLVQILGEHGSSVVFFDIVIADRPEGADQADQDLAARNIAPLAEAVSAAQGRGTKIVFAQIRRPQDAVNVCSVGPSRMAGALSKHLMCLADAVAPIGWYSDIPGVDYPIAVARPYGGGGPDLSPGVVVAIAMEGGARSDAARLPKMAAGDLYLSWGAGGYASGGDCERFDPEIGRGWLEHLSKALPAVLGNFDGTDRAVRNSKYCTYLPEVSADRLITNMAHPGSDGWLADDRLLRQRAVFVGLDMSGSRQDRLTPPVGPDTAGVLVHAVATENLLSLGADGVHYYRSAEDAWWRMPLLAGMVVVLMESCRQSLEQLTGLTERHRASLRTIRLRAVAIIGARAVLIWVLSASAIVVLSVTLLGWVLQLPLANVLSVLALVLIIDGLADIISFIRARISGHG